MSGPYAATSRRYHAANWGSPLPLPPRRKKEPPKGWTGYNGPQASAADVEAWCEDHPDGNIGMRLGPGIIGIDVDAHKGPAELAAWQDLEKSYGPLPGTAPWCSSRDDGISGIRLFTVPDGYAAVTVMGLAGEIIQRHHRYVVVPPSISPPPPLGTSQPYRWIGRPDDYVPSRDDIPPLPQAWLDGLRAGSNGQQPGPGFQQPGRLATTGWTQPDAEHLVTGGIPAGVNQDEHLRDLVFECVRYGMSGAAVRAVWSAAVARTPLRRPGEPWADSDFERHYRGALRKTGPTNKSSEEDEELSRLGQLRAALLDSAGLDNLPVPESLIDGWLFRDSLAWLHGKPGNGKSLVSLDWAACIDAGLPWLSQPVSKGPVLYVIAEGATGLHARVRAWEDRAQIKTGVRFLPVAIQLLNTGDASAIAELAAELATALVVIDTQARVTVGAEENSAVDMGRVVVAAEQIRRASHACVLFVHHEARGGENMRGSTALEGAADTVLRVVKDGPRIELTNPKQKDAAEHDPAVLWVVPRLRSVVIAGNPILQRWSPGQHQKPRSSACYWSHLGVPAHPQQHSATQPG